MKDSGWFFNDNLKAMSREVFEALAFYLSSALRSFYEIKEENKIFSSSSITYGFFFL